MSNLPDNYKEFYKKHHEIIMYCVFGVSTTIISWLVFSICEVFLHLDLYTCGLVSWIIAVAVAFVTNKIYVFESKSWKWALVAAELVTFVGGRVITGFIEIIAVPLLVKAGFDATLFGVEGLPAKITVSLLVVVINYVLSKFISFNIAKKEK